MPLLMRVTASIVLVAFAASSAVAFRAPHADDGFTCTASLDGKGIWNSTVTEECCNNMEHQALYNNGRCEKVGKDGYFNVKEMISCCRSGGHGAGWVSERGHIYRAESVQR